ncbi:MAG: N-6 DNA methylase [Methanobacteriota archaeon]
MTSEISFTENVLKAFKNITKEIEKGSSEHDVRYRFVKYFVEEVLGYEPKYIKWEKKRADLTIVDENNFAIIKIETKKPNENIEKPEYKEQAFKYEEETTRFIGLTNFLQFKLWEVKKTESELNANIDFSRILEQRKPIEQLTSEEKSQILFLNNLTKESLFNPSKYEKFDENYARIDLTKEAGFRKLLDRLNFIADNLLLGYTLRAFGEYQEGYNKYQEELKKIDNFPKNDKNSYHLAKYHQKIEDEYSKYKTFSGFYLWKSYSGKEHFADDGIKEVFCKESIYILLNKLLFLRICEDKGFLEKNISNGGIEELRNLLKKRFENDVINKELLELAFKSAKGLYAHFYETGILDWFRTGDGELNEILNRILWILNQFDFTHVDRDILGNLYEKYLPSKERKRLGEFYTPTEVIDYILTSVGYTYSYDIETKDLLDPACGSGGFLVRATRRLISRFLMKFGKADKKELRDPKNWKEIVDRLSPEEAKIVLEAIQEHIYGLDINPFACHIAEMNILFQIIDLYQKVKEKHPDYKLKRFKIYQTDSLELPKQKTINDFGNHLKFLEEQEEIDAIKNKKFDFVVGNPPYVRVQMLDERTKEYLKKEYSKTVVGKFDIYIPFIQRGIDWLKDNQKLGYINPNLFLNRDYGKNLRKFLLESTRILQIINFGDSGVFNDVTNYPCILVVQKSAPQKEDTIKTILVYQPKEYVLWDIQKKYYQTSFKNEYFSMFEVEQNKLGIEQWKLIPYNLTKIFNKIKSSSDRTLMDVSERIYEGFITGNNTVYFVTEEKVKQFRLERDLLKNVPKGRNVKRWHFFSNTFVIYPHQDIEGKTEVITDLKSKYPNIWQYFKNNEETLQKRKYLMDAIKKSNRKEWFEIWNPRSYSWFKQPKIITPNLSTGNNFAFDEEGVFLDHDCYGIILKEKSRNSYLYVLGLLNSQLLEFYLKQISPYASGKYYRYMTGYLQKLPIKLPETAEEKKIANQIIKKVDEILELHKQGVIDIDAVLEGEETERLYNLPKVTFSIKDDAKFEGVKVEGSKIFINSEDFVEIKDKKILDFVGVYLNFSSEKLAKSKDVKGIILNLPVPTSEEILKEIVKKGSADHSQIKEKIKRLEQEINELVYEIYGVTREERKIVGENLKL